MARQSRFDGEQDADGRCEHCGADPAIEHAGFCPQRVCPPEEIAVFSGGDYGEFEHGYFDDED